ncbi:TipJ family phage tail tip protein [Pseudomonas fulva]|uniref:TipJ family phage tail tip protein n=1 Tax=Pseudomonas fulva TaxID=47880 RepID=UPI0015E2FD98|nr:phage tail protein [Pseudomonas fulva]MBA1217281.1 DUF1983 domain-containing protein [Pseudomonas fulva]
MVQVSKRAPQQSRAARKRQVVGSKGGEKKQKQPSIASNSVPSIAVARLLYLWSWGPIVGPVNGLRSVKLDGTQVMADDGTMNYPGVKWQFRSGELNQERMTGITESSNEIAVGQLLLTTAPYVHTISNPMLDAVRLRFSWPQLQRQDQSGNIDGVRIEYAIDVSTDNGPFQQVLASEVNRKNVTKYERSHRIELPAGSRWTVRARRITPEANSSLTQDGMYVEALSEVVDSDQEYPLTAVSCVEYDAEQFGGDIAKIAVLMRGRIVRVPANYNAETRTYGTSGVGTTNGVWDGTFKEAYTNNPAWVFYDLVLHPYYGLGDRIDPSMINRWSLYRIGQYCDQLVPDGMGGQEPRFTCNLYLQKQAEAWAVIQDLAAIFHGLAFWDGSQITVNADLPQDPVYNYTLSQILDDGAVKYTGSKLRERHSQAMVSFDDPARGYDTDKEPVFDEDAIAEYGVREISVEAVGCTSRGQAQRAGQWALMTEQLQLRGATFRVGLDGYIPKPGKVITLSDPMLAGRANGGRIAAVNGRIVTVDRDVEVPTGARLLVNLPSGKAEARVIRSVAGRQITVVAEFSEAPQPECAWVLDFDDLKVMQFYVRNITRPEWHQFQLECIQYEPGKFDAIDFGTIIDDRPISVLPPGVQDAPARVLIGSHSAVDQGIAVTTMTISWDAAPGAVAYDVEWRWGSRDWVRVPRTGQLTADVRGVYAGQYLARVRAVSAMDVSSIPTTSVLTEVAGKTTPPPAVTFLRAESLIFGIKVTIGYPAGASDTQRAELWYGPGSDLAAATKLTDLAYPQADHTLQGLRAGQTFYFWARLVDRSGNIGPWFPVDAPGIKGQASADAGPILEQIAKQIGESELGKELTSKIEKIALIDGNGPGSVNERVGAAKTELAKQIGEVNNALGTVKGNLEQQITAVSADVSAAKAELQQQIANVSALAGSLPYRKDKAYSVGQSALGSDGKLYQALKAVPLNTPPPNATYWTDVGQAVVTANGMAARVSKVETDVSTLDGKVTAQASQISGLQAGLSTTNDNLAKKADASAVSSLGLRVSDAEGKLTSQATRMDGMQTSIDGKASSQALQQVTSRVTATEDKDKAQDQLISSQSQALTSLTDSVSKKAEASTVQALGNDVKSQGNILSAQGSSLTKIEASIPGLAGENLLYNPSFERKAPGDTGLADGWLQTGAGGTTRIATLVPSQLAPAEFAQRLDATGLGAGVWIRLQTTDAKRASVSAGQALTFSVYMRATPGLILRAELYFRRPDGTPSAGGAGVAGLSITATGSFQRVTVSGITPDDASICAVYPVAFGTAAVTSGFFEADRAQLEAGEVATGWRDSGQVNAADAVANASATTLLAGRVTKNEEGIKSTSELATQLGNSLVTTNGNVDKAQSAAQAANDLAGGKGKVIVQSPAPATADRLAQNLWIDTTGNANTPKRWTGTTWAAVTDKVATDAAAAAQSALGQVALKADSSALQALGSTVSQQGQQIQADGQAITRIDASLNQVKSDTASNASATSALTGRVGATEAGLTSVSGQLTEVSNSIGTAGGENLLYNPSFEKRAQGNANLADGWTYTGAGGTTRTPSLVASQLVPAELAQRLDVTGFGRNLWVRMQPVDARRVSVSAGQTLTFSVYMRGTAGLIIRAELYFRKADGSPVNGTFGASLTAGNAFQRVEVTATVPADAVYCEVYPVAFGIDSISTGFFEADRAQLEQSSRATGWRDNGQVVIAEQSATSSAVDTLNSAVSQQAGRIESATSRTTALENTVNSSSSGLATKASAAAMNTLSGRVTATETGLTSAGNSLNRLSSQIGSIGGTGSNLIPAEFATFTASPPSMHMASTLTLSSVQDAAAYSGYLIKADSASGPAWLYLAASAGDYNLRLVAGRQYIFSVWSKGSAAHSVGVRLRYQNSAGGAVEVGLSSVDVGTSLGRVSTVITIPSGVVGPASIVLYTQAGSAAGTTWFDGFMLEEKIGEAITPSAFTPGTSTRQAAGQALAVSALDTKVTQQGAKIESEAKRTDGLYTSVGNANSAIQDETTARASADSALSTRINTAQAKANEAAAAVQSEVQARADADGALSKRVDTAQATAGNANAAVQQVATAQSDMKGMLNAQYTMRVQINNQMGVHHWGGFGIGINEQNGVVQSAFVVYSDQFVLLNANGGGLSSPFSVVGGQTFISDAYIRNASIGTAKIANGAIANAQIQDAAITNSKIGNLQVDTLKIGNEAVTIPRYAGYAPRFNCNGSWQTPLTITFYMPQPGMVYINYCATFLSNGTQFYQYRLVLDGNMIAESVANWSDSSITLASGQYVGAGQHTVDFSILGAVGVVLSYQNLMVQGIMR